MQRTILLQALPGQDTGMDQLEELSAGGVIQIWVRAVLPLAAFLLGFAAWPGGAPRAWHAEQSRSSLLSQRSLLWGTAELAEVTHSPPQVPLRPVINTQEQADQHSQPAPPERESGHTQHCKSPPLLFIMK